MPEAWRIAYQRLAQSYCRENYEIIMVDNNSTDDSAEIVRQYPRVKLISEGKQGTYTTRNRGLKETKGEIIAFTDPDCVAFSDWLQKIAEVFVDPGIGIAIGNHKLARDSVALSIPARYENEKNNYVFNSKVKEIYLVPEW